VPSVIYHVDIRKRDRSLALLFRSELTLFRAKISIWPSSVVQLTLITLQRLSFYFLPFSIKKLVLNFLGKNSYSFIGEQKIKELIAIQIKGPIN